MPDFRGIQGIINPRDGTFWWCTKCGRQGVVGADRKHTVEGDRYAKLCDDCCPDERCKR